MPHRALPSPDHLRDALAAHAWVEHAALPGRTNHHRAGVLVPLSWSDAGLHCIVTLRTAHLSRHGGEVSFPGGRPEPTDPDLQATALREAHEEIGLSEAQVLGRLSSTPVYTSDFRLEPFVAHCPPGAPLNAEPGEVAEILSLDLGAVLHRGEIESVVIPTPQGVFEMPVFRPGGWVLFGATALVLTELLGVMATSLALPTPRLRAGALTFEELLRRGASAGRP
jgi:8-oxo-dGTP pyrophosphatase MutT (NUDIX family)